MSVGPWRLVQAPGKQKAPDVPGPARPVIGADEDAARPRPIPWRTGPETGWPDPTSR